MTKFLFHHHDMSVEFMYALKIINFSFATTEQILMILRIFTLCSLKLQSLHYFWYFQQNLLFHGIQGICQNFSNPKGQFTKGFGIEKKRLT